MICLGDTGIDPDATVNKHQLVKTEISLTLTNKFEVPEENQTDVKSLLIRFGNRNNFKSTI